MRVMAGIDRFEVVISHHLRVVTGDPLICEIDQFQLVFYTLPAARPPGLPCRTGSGS